ncbi:uncharacterized protein LOC120174759 [Hibiscus syriacus]|uniref:uncharacterized protein LOC120174759 n=1 Tax=Hibiscus syriacus TaxID=106335 RepID=UPI001921D996|nr:uncharacterized protein LOC120174759 [Hibiscus syriacus]
MDEACSWLDYFKHEGLRLAWENGYRHVYLQFDCLEAVPLVNDDHYANCSLVQSINHIRERQWTIRVEWIPREANRIVDALAHSQIDILAGMYVYTEPLVSILDLLNRDCYAPYMRA